MSRHVHVVVRCRPPTDPASTCVRIDEKSIVISQASEELRFQPDAVVPSSAPQDVVWTDHILPQLLPSLEQHGYVNVAVLAYGQTGSGKTYTIDGSCTAPEMEGIAPRAIRFAFESLASGAQATVEMSFLEIHQQKLCDLLNPSTPSTSLRVRTCPVDVRRFVVENLSSMRVRSVEEGLATFARGVKHKTFRCSSHNAHSSRSHAILTLRVVSPSIVGGTAPPPPPSEMSIVDLAGSERCHIDGSGGRGGDNANVLQRESIAINTSLTALRQVVMALSKFKTGGGHVPFRDSKLTMLLRHTLGGNAATVVITCVRSDMDAAAETIAALRFGILARAVACAVEPPATTRGRDATVIVALRKRIAELTADLQTAQATIAAMRRIERDDGCDRNRAEDPEPATTAMQNGAPREDDHSGGSPRVVDEISTVKVVFQAAQGLFQRLQLTLEANLRLRKALDASEIQREQAEGVARGAQDEAMRLMEHVEMLESVAHLAEPTHRPVLVHASREAPRRTLLSSHIRRPKPPAARTSHSGRTHGI